MPSHAMYQIVGCSLRCSVAVIAAVCPWRQPLASAGTSALVCIAQLNPALPRSAKSDRRFAKKCPHQLSDNPSRASNLSPHSPRAGPCYTLSQILGTSQHSGIFLCVLCPASPPQRVPEGCLESRTFCQRASHSILPEKVFGTQYRRGSELLLPGAVARSILLYCHCFPHASSK
jgi:hypothetical protein